MYMVVYNNGSCVARCCDTHQAVRQCAARHGAQRAATRCSSPPADNAATVRSPPQPLIQATPCFLAPAHSMPLATLPLLHEGVQRGCTGNEHRRPLHYSWRGGGHLEDCTLRRRALRWGHATGRSGVPPATPRWQDLRSVVGAGRVCVCWMGSFVDTCAQKRGQASTCQPTGCAHKQRRSAGYGA